MPESRVRKEAAKKKLAQQHHEAAEERQKTARLKSGGRDWVPWVFVPLALLGVLWMVVWNLAGRMIPFMSALGNWNLGISVGLIIASFFLMTLWK